MRREEIDAEMRAALVKLATCSHVPATSYEPRGRSGATESRDLSGGDRGPDTFARLYGPPFHDEPARARTDKAVNGLAGRLGIDEVPARTDHDRLKVLEAATDEYEHLTGTSAVRPERPTGETAAERDARIVRDGRGWSVRDAAIHFRCGEGDVRRARKNGKLVVDGKTRPVDIETGEPVPDPERSPEHEGRTVRGRPRDARGRITGPDPAASERQQRRRRQLEDLVYRRGHSLRAAARIVGISHQTAARALGRQDAETTEADVA